MVGLPSARTQAILPGSSTVARASVAGRRSEADGGGAGSVIGRPGPIHELASLALSLSRAAGSGAHLARWTFQRGLWSEPERNSRKICARVAKKGKQGVSSAGARRSVMTGPTKVAKVAAKAASGGMASKFLRWVNSEAGPKTTHFWGPIANWGFVVAVSAPHTTHTHSKYTLSVPRAARRRGPDRTHMGTR